MPSPPALAFGGSNLSCPCTSIPHTTYPHAHAQGITGSHLLRLTEADLAGTGLASKEARQQLLSSRDRLRKGSPAASQNAPSSRPNTAGAAAAGKGGAAPAAAAAAGGGGAQGAKLGRAQAAMAVAMEAAAAARAPSPPASPAHRAAAAAGATRISHGSRGTPNGVSAQLAVLQAAHSPRHAPQVPQGPVPPERAVVYVLRSSPNGRLYRAQLEVPRLLQALAEHIGMLHDIKRCAHYHLLNCRALLWRFVAAFDLLSDTPGLQPTKNDLAARTRALAAAGLRQEEPSSGEHLVSRAGSGSSARTDGKDGGGQPSADAHAHANGSGSAGGGGDASAHGGPRDGAWVVAASEFSSGAGAVLAAQLEDLVSDAHDLFASFSET
jgi:hypothetical protein